MTDQADLFTLSRQRDPWTSRAAGRSVADVSRSQEDVLSLLRRFGPATDEEIALRHAARVALGEMKRQSPSGLRTRRSELQRAGKIVATGRVRHTVSGRATLEWAAL